MCKLYIIKQLINNNKMAKRNKIAAIAAMKCPRCREGDMFYAPIIQGIYKMNKECPVCKQAFELEPGFYWGAMYVGYGLSGGYMLSTVGAMLLFLNWSLEVAFAISILGGIIIFPLIARLARVIWINIYVGYDKNYVETMNKAESKNVKSALSDK
jgi:uncharacterized protein (DUF983 family)